MTDLGLHKAIVVNNSDPLGNNRLLVQIPTLTGESSVWAESCHPYGSVSIPPVATGVWVAFEGGSAHRPVWLGSFGPSVPPVIG
jgi:phage gp45-like